MPNYQQIAIREDVSRTRKSLHPILFKDRNKFVWQTLVGLNAKHGPVSAATLRNVIPDIFHPQILADLKNNFLVLERGRRNGHTLYIADPNGRGLHTQSVEITVELYECADGSFQTKTILHGRVNSKSKPVRLIKSRTIRLIAPPMGAPGTVEVSGETKLD